MTTVTESVRKAPRWMWIVLLVSLALNLLVAGAAVGHRIGGHDGGWHGRWHALRGLPAAERERVRDLLKSQRERIGPLRKELREARRAVIKALEVEPYDEAGVKAALAIYRQRRGAVGEALEPGFLELARTLGPEARVQVLRRFLRGGGRRHRWGRHRRMRTEDR